MKKTQQGFVVNTLLVVIAICAVIAVAYFVLKSVEQRGKGGSVPSFSDTVTGNITDPLLGYVPQVVDGNTVAYDNDDIGIVFTRAKSWSEPYVQAQKGSSGFSFIISTGPIFVEGTSADFVPLGPAYAVNIISENDVLSACDAEETKVIRSSDNEEGAYALGTIVSFGTCDDIFGDAGHAHYAAFDGAGNLSSVVFRADPTVLSKDDFLAVVESVSFDE